MTKKPNQLLERVIQDNVDLSTADLIRRRDVAWARQNAVESELIELAAKAHDARRRMRQIAAEVEGLAEVMRRR